MASVISGKDMLLFFRKRADHATADASKLRFQTEHSISMEKESQTQHQQKTVTLLQFQTVKTVRTFHL